MNLLSLLFLPLIAQASPPPGVVMLSGSCTIERPSGSQTVKLWMGYHSRLSVLGYKGEDGGEYEINIANNGGNKTFEALHGSVVIGFGRANAEVRNPPRLCPVAPEEARRECLAENERNNPPFVPAPTDTFENRPNLSGDVKYEILMGEGGPDNFRVTKIAVPKKDLREFEAVTIQTPRAALGGVLASCLIKATQL